MPLSIVHEIRLGAVRASIWRESDLDGICHSVTVSRAIDGSRRHAAPNRFHVDELPLVAEAMDLAHLWIEQVELVLDT
jgi:hypothetical protein